MDDEPRFDQKVKGFPGLLETDSVGGPQDQDVVQVKNGPDSLGTQDGLEKSCGLGVASGVSRLISWRGGDSRTFGRRFR